MLQALHWLPVKERVQYKVILYIFKCIQSEAPDYLTELITLQSSQYPPGYRGRLRSSTDLTRLSVPRSKRKAGDASFMVGAPRLWNALPMDLRGVISIPVFRRMLKTHLFPIEV